MTRMNALASKAKIVNTKSGERVVINALTYDRPAQSIALWGSVDDAAMLAVSNGEKIIVEVTQPSPSATGSKPRYKFVRTVANEALLERASANTRALLQDEPVVDASEPAVATVIDGVSFASCLAEVDKMIAAGLASAADRGYRARCLFSALQGAMI